MSLTLHYHPLSSFCMKALVALYENGTAFKPLLVNLGEKESREAFLKVWAIGKFPVLQDDARNEIVPESTTVIEYLDQHYSGSTKFIPDDNALALQVRQADRLTDLYIHMEMQKVIGDRLRPADKKDPYGVEQARNRMRTAYDIMDKAMAARNSAQTWAVGETFTLADCAACPALYYGNKATPFEDTHKNLAAYYHRLLKRPSFARTLEEAKPYNHLFPKE
jgi:glutathione S-transferase